MSNRSIECRRHVELEATLRLALEALENLEEHLPFDWAFDELQSLAGKDEYRKDLAKARSLIPVIYEALANHIPDTTKMVSQPEQEQSGFFSREAMKAHSDGHVTQLEREAVVDFYITREMAKNIKELKTNWTICASGSKFPTEKKTVPVFIDYTAPPYVPTERQRTWVGLSIFEIDELVYETEYDDYHDLVRRTEALLEEKNNVTR